MRKVTLILTIIAFCTTSILAGPSLSFSTGSAYDSSWTVSPSSGIYTMSFANIEADTSNPSGDAVLGDSIRLPDMVLSDIYKNVLGMIEAKLVPVTGERLAITADSGALAGSVVMTSSVGTGGLLTLGKNWMAYSHEEDDLDIISHTAGYSAVVDGFWNAEAQGFDIDLSFTGDSVNSLYVMLDKNLSGAISGALCGQITTTDVAVTPTPGAVLLGSVGICLIGWLRRRRTL